MTARPTRELLTALTAEGAEVRFVGGCVRDALLRRESTDIDISTPDPPQRVMALLQRAGLPTKSVPRGIEHGTVIAAHDDNRYEITTLRRDERTDGRYANVAFTANWKADAARRDFTINAMSATPVPDNMLYDYFGGQEDLKAGRVRFVGDPATRIAEDHLRLLRFFRFYAWYGRGAPDEAALAVCKTAAHTIPTLSGERLRDETLKLLAARDPLPAVRTMQETGVLASLLPEVRATGRLINLLEIERTLDEPVEPVRRLAALITDTDTASADEVAARLRLTASDGARLAALSDLPAAFNRDLDSREQRRLLYRLGPARFRDLRLLGWALQDEIESETTYPAMLKDALEWKAPTFPVTGADILARGIPEGPEVGRLLAAVEEWWIERDFRPDRAAALEQLDALIAQR